MESFDLPVLYRNTELVFPAELHAYGYSYKIKVFVNGDSFFFERDEERQWRAVTMPDEKEPVNTDRFLLEEIANSLEQLLA
jgi:hypothetical protein